MRTEEARPIRLEDYRPPDWLVETVELDVSLDATASRVLDAVDAFVDGMVGARPDVGLLGDHVLELVDAPLEVLAGVEHLSLDLSTFSHGVS